MDRPTTDRTNLYRTAAGHPVVYADIITALKKSGVCRGDCLFVHSDVSRFGLAGNVGSRRVLFDQLLQALYEAVSESGTIIMPTFTYSFTDGKVYDHDHTPSTVGMLTEYFRKQDDTIRTVHPIFSVAVRGTDKDYFLSGLGKDSFGEDSIFGRLHARHAHLLFFGAPFQSCTFVHYIEKLASVPYRFVKTFDGTIRAGDRTFSDSYQFLVKHLDQDVVTDLSRLEDHLLENGVMKKVPLGDGHLLRVSTDDMVKAGMQLLHDDIYFFLKHPPR
ncbi:MAG: AAC(3) family N-acetyltransferase [Candidatus Zixiibacteriota bacterium]|nr:MAG: AAC(3) family N-acetyltransferase [candidate division Zixibacteria bacterium]